MRLSTIREKRVKARLYAFITGLKEGKPCVDCGNIYEPHCMEFDHLGGKKHPVSSMVAMKASRKRVLEEVSKTELVCTLCHRFRTFFRRLEKRTATTPPKPQYVLVLRAKCRPCSECGVRRPFYQTDLDHLDPHLKSFSLSNARNFSCEAVAAELLKCQLLCALCHRRKTYQGVYLAFLGSALGERRPNVKITQDVLAQVLSMKASAVPQNVIAKQVGLANSTVSQIVRGTYTNTKLST